MNSHYAVGQPVSVRDNSKREAYSGTITGTEGTLADRLGGRADIPEVVEISYEGLVGRFDVFSREALDDCQITFDIFH